MFTFCIVQDIAQVSKATYKDEGGDSAAATWSITQLKLVRVQPDIFQQLIAFSALPSVAVVLG